MMPLVMREQDPTINKLIGIYNLSNPTNTLVVELHELFGPFPHHIILQNKLVGPLVTISIGLPTYQQLNDSLLITITQLDFFWSCDCYFLGRCAKEVTIMRLGRYRRRFTGCLGGWGSHEGGWRARLLRELMLFNLLLFERSRQVFSFWSRWGTRLRSFSFNSNQDVFDIREIQIFKSVCFLLF